jgi:hypothetical protein
VQLDGTVNEVVDVYSTTFCDLLDALAATVVPIAARVTPAEAAFVVIADVMLALVTPADAALVVIADVMLEFVGTAAATAVAISVFCGPTPGVMLIAIMQSPLH